MKKGHSCHPFLGAETGLHELHGGSPKRGGVYSQVASVVASGCLRISNGFEARLFSSFEVPHMELASHAAVAQPFVDHLRFDEAPMRTRSRDLERGRQANFMLNKK